MAGLTGSSGPADGVGTNSRFTHLSGVSISSDGVHALITDQYNHLIRHILISTAYVTTLAGKAGVSGSSNGIETNSRFNLPYGVTISPDGVYALVGQEGQSLIRRITINLVGLNNFVSLVPSAAPSLTPTIPSTRYPFFIFGVKLNDGIPSLSILVDYIQDTKRGEIHQSLSRINILTHPLTLCVREDQSHISPCQLFSSLLRF